MAKRWAMSPVRRTTHPIFGRAILSLAYPDALPRAAAEWRLRWPMVAAPMSIRRLRWRASRCSRWPSCRYRAQSRVCSPPDHLEEIGSASLQIERRDDIIFDAASGSLRGRRSERLGAITLVERPYAVTPGPEAAKQLAEGIIRLGLDRLPWTKSLQQWRDRVMFLRRAGSEEWPDLSSEALAGNADEWLVPLLYGKTTLASITADELSAAIGALLP